MANRDFDLILWGATGFTGKLVAEMISGNGTSIDMSPYRFDRFR